MHALPASPAAARLAHIAHVRRAVLCEGEPPLAHLPAWLARSWQRCLSLGHSPEHRLSFATVTRSALAQALQRSRGLRQAAEPVIAQLAQAVADAGVFALLTDAAGVVVGVYGTVDRSDRRATALARVGVDLSEAAVGTTAIGAALAELAPVWLHRGEHFFDDTAAYSCAGAPIIGPAGHSVGMLDLTGIDIPERPGLRHLVAQAAQRIENALVLAQPHRLLLRLGWPGQPLGGGADGLLSVDGEGALTGFNPAAAAMLGLTAGDIGQPLSQWLATPLGTWFDARDRSPQLAPLWSGLRVQVWARASDALPAAPSDPAAPAPWAAPASPPTAPQATAPHWPPASVGRGLREIETELIRRTVAAHRGNVAAAAQALGISRATVYRKLGSKRP